MASDKRLNEILRIINDYEIETQEELTAKLNSLGYSTSQATISRDIKKLNLVKAPAVTKKSKYVRAVLMEDVPEKFKNLFRQVTISISVANNLIVIKTMSGNASTAGMAVDGMHIQEILGTVAGDDTLLVIAKTEQDAENIQKSLRKLCINAD